MKAIRLKWATGNVLTLLGAVDVSETGAVTAVGPLGRPDLDYQVATQEALAIQAESRRQYHRRNAVVTLRWTVSRTHASKEAAEDFLLLHPAAIRQRNDVTCEIELHASTETLRYVPTPVVTCTITKNGLTTQTAYTLRGGLPQTTDPNA